MGNIMLSDGAKLQRIYGMTKGSYRFAGGYLLGRLLLVDILRMFSRAAVRVASWMS